MTGDGDQDGPPQDVCIRQTRLWGHLISEAIKSCLSRKPNMKHLTRVPLSILAGSSLAAFGVGYVVAPTEQLDTEVMDSGLPVPHSPYEESIR